MFQLRRNCMRWTVLAISFVILSSHGSQAQSLQLRNMPLADLFSRLDFRQPFQLGTTSLLDWIKWILKISSAFLDPLYIGHLQIDVDEKDVTAHLRGDAVTIQHLLSSTISNVTVEKDKLGVSANITFPQLGLQGVYNLSGRVDELEMDINGKGYMAVKVTDVKVYGALRMNIGSKLTLRLEDLDYSLQDLSVQLDNLMGGGAVCDMLNGVMSDVGPVAANDFKANITQAIMDKVNKALASYVP